jgi:hypothetical protein
VFSLQPQLQYTFLQQRYSKDTRTRSTMLYSLYYIHTYTINIYIQVFSLQPHLQYTFLQRYSKDTRTHSTMLYSLYYIHTYTINIYIQVFYNLNYRTPSFNDIQKTLASIALQFEVDYKEEDLVSCFCFCACMNVSMARQFEVDYKEEDLVSCFCFCACMNVSIARQFEVDYKEEDLVSCFCFCACMNVSIARQFEVDSEEEDDMVNFLRICICMCGMYVRTCVTYTYIHTQTHVGRHSFH